MYFKVKKDTQAYNLITNYFEKVQKSHDDMKLICDEVGTNQYANMSDYFNECKIVFKFEEKPKGFKNYDKSRQLYQTVKSNPINERLSKISFPSRSDLNNAVGFEMNHGIDNGRLTMNAGVTKSHCEDVYLIDSGNGTVDITLGLTEILESEYNRLKQTNEESITV